MLSFVILFVLFSLTTAEKLTDYDVLEPLKDIALLKGQGQLSSSIIFINSTYGSFELSVRETNGPFHPKLRLQVDGHDETRNFNTSGFYEGKSTLHKDSYAIFYVSEDLSKIVGFLFITKQRYFCIEPVNHHQETEFQKGNETWLVMYRGQNVRRNNTDSIEPFSAPGATPLALFETEASLDGDRRRKREAPPQMLVTPSSGTIVPIKASVEAEASPDSDRRRKREAPPQMLVTPSSGTIVPIKASVEAEASPDSDRRRKREAPQMLVTPSSETIVPIKASFEVEASPDSDRRRKREARPQILVTPSSGTIVPIKVILHHTILRDSLSPFLVPHHVDPARYVSLVIAIVSYHLQKAELTNWQTTSFMRNLTLAIKTIEVHSQATRSPEYNRGEARPNFRAQLKLTQDASDGHALGVLYTFQSYDHSGSGLMFTSSELCANDYNTAIVTLKNNPPNDGIKALQKSIHQTMRAVGLILGSKYSHDRYRRLFCKEDDDATFFLDYSRCMRVSMFDNIQRRGNCLESSGAESLGLSFTMFFVFVVGFIF